tara:strand:- start:720 stop:2078 length:1359 start_codon:yes stop_codon:yes gene_type:complete
MATFEARVEGLTGINIDGSSSPNQTELTQFLQDGVLDITQRILSIRPEESNDFTRISSASSSQAALSADSNRIISVVRESGTNDDWREARRIPIGLQSRVTDSTSLSYATAYNPAFIISEEGTVLVYPAPDSSSTQYKIYYVNGSPVNLSGDALDYADSNIKYFPESKVYLVMLYASCQSLLNNLSNFSISQTVPSLTLPSAPVPPSAPSFSTPTIQAVTVGTMPDIDATTISNLGVPPTYTAPTVSGDATSLTDIEDLDADNTIDVLADQIEFEQFWSVAAHLIEDEEDVELANAQLQKIRTYVEAYSTQMQSNLNDFQKEQAEYQGKTQEALQQAQINAAKAQSQAQIDASKVTAQAQLDASDATQTASLLLQKENQEYASKLQKFQSDLGKYTSEVQAKVQDHTSQINEISAEIQIDTTEYNWKSQRYAALKGQYDQAFGLMAPREGKD